MSEQIAEVVLSLDEVHALALRVLTHNGMSDAHARAIANVITQGQRDECHSHGVYRLLVCVRSLRKGKVDPQAVPTLRRLSSSIVAVDAHRGFSLLSFETGLPVLVEMAKQHGIAAMAINHCYHFSALWPRSRRSRPRGWSASR